MTISHDPALQAWIDQDDRLAAETIRKYGTRIVYVGGDECVACAALNRADRRRLAKQKKGSNLPFAYTVGLFGIGHPELLVLGTDQQTAGGLLNDVSARIRAGHDLTPGELLSFDGWHHHALVEVVPNPGEIAFEANRFYRRPDEASVELFQLTLDDCDGRLPGEAGYSPRWRQPRPGEFRA